MVSYLVLLCLYEPPGVINTKKERLSKEQIEAEIPITTVRGACEAVFKRIVNEESLREKIPYWLIRWLPHAHALAHGEANLCQPLREIGRHSIVGADYWQNQVDYTRTPQMNIPSQNVEISTRRACRKCKEGGIVKFAIVAINLIILDRDVTTLQTAPSIIRIHMHNNYCNNLCIM